MITRRFMIYSKPTTREAPVLLANGAAFYESAVIIVPVPGSGVPVTMMGNVAELEAWCTEHGFAQPQFHDDDAETVWLCCMCFSDMDVPLNHCYQCGAGGAAVAMSRSQLDAIQKHDKDRLDAYSKLYDETRALRRLAIDIYGPASLGLVVDRWEDHEKGEIRRSLRRGSTIFGCNPPRDNEADADWLARVGDSATLDPKQVLEVHKERKHDWLVSSLLATIESFRPLVAQTRKLIREHREKEVLGTTVSALAKIVEALPSTPPEDE
jgi:hypothetical protein